MPRAFKEEEKEKIRAKLLEAGRSCFLRYGLKKTTIEDVVGPAGIAKSSFYLFFDSKEALFVEVMMAELPAMTKRLIDASFGATDDVREALVLLMRGVVHEMEINELARILLDERGEWQRLAEGLDYEDILRRATGEVFGPLYAQLKQAQDAGEIIEGDIFQIVYVTGLVKILAINREYIPAELYNAMLDLAPQVIADGLTCPARKQRGDR